MIVRHAEGLVGFEIPDDSPLARSVAQEAITRQAEAHHEAYPQYVGYWRGPEWRMATVTRRVKTKLGVAFEPGDRTIARERDAAETLNYGLTEPTAYSWRNRINTAVPSGSLVFDEAES